MKNTDRIKSEFARIKSLKFVPCTSPNNKDGGIGNTFEDLLGVIENNKKEPDFEGFEIKSQRLFNSSYISLFTKSPDFPSGANSILREKFGEIRDTKHSHKKKLYASVFGNRDSTIYSKYKMQLIVNRTNQKLELEIKNLEHELLMSVYWEFDTIMKASKKMDDLLLVYAETKKIENETLFHYTQAELYENFSFDMFLIEIEKGNIMFDIRIGVYNSGKNYGKTHDHGSGFRVKSENFRNLYESFERL